MRSLLLLFIVSNAAAQTFNVHTVGQTGGVTTGVVINSGVYISPEMQTVNARDYATRFDFLCTTLSKLAAFVPGVSDCELIPHAHCEHYSSMQHAVASIPGTSHSDKVCCLCGKSWCETVGTPLDFSQHGPHHPQRPWTFDSATVIDCTKTHDLCTTTTIQAWPR